MKVSIALATYNGEKYLLEQLESFQAQTRAPDELVICDDDSSDGTAFIVDQFSKQVSFAVRFERNAINLGYKKNFEKCIRLCDGDVILASDQDDVWFPEKIERVLTHFSGSDELRVTINDQAITDSALIPTGNTIFGNSDHFGFGEQWLSAGCCTAMSREFVRLALPFPVDATSHDGWIHALAMALEVRIVIPDVLQLYRRHGANTSDPLAVRNVRFPTMATLREHGMKVSLESWIGELRSSIILRKRLQRYLTEQEASDLGAPGSETLRFRQAIDRVKVREAHLYERLQLMCGSRISRIGSIYRFHRGGGYESFQGWKSALKDALRPAISANHLRTFIEAMQEVRGTE